MNEIVFEGWKEGFDKVALSKLLRAEIGLSLSQSKNIVDRILDGDCVVLPVQNSFVADSFVDKARCLNVLVKRGAADVGWIRRSRHPLSGASRRGG